MLNLSRKWKPQSNNTLQNQNEVFVVNRTPRKRAYISAVGMYVPEKVLDNAYFEKILDTNDEWIMSRTGIKERRFLEDGPASVLGTEAVKDMMEKHNIDPLTIDCIICCTVTPDMLFPSTASIIQHNVGAKNAWGFDMEAACSGFVFGLATGTSFIESGLAKRVVVVGAEKMTSISDYTNRNTCILFGDAGSCVLLEPSPDDEVGIVDTILNLDGSGKDALYMLGGGSLNPPSHETVDNGMHFIYQDGKAVFKVAVVGMADVSYEMMQRHNLTPDDIAFLVPHQANLRIIDATAKRMGLPSEKVMINIHKYGNTTSATIPLCLTEYYREGKLKKGDNIILAAFGAGYSWGSTLIKWGI